MLVRDFRQGDYQVLASWFDDTETQNRLGPRTWLDRVVALADGDPDRCLVTAREGDCLVALVDIDIEDGQAGLAIVVDPLRRREGWGSGALRAVLDDERFSHITSWRVGVEPDNHASLKTFRGVGFLDLGERDDEGFVYLVL